MRLKLLLLSCISTLISAQANLFEYGIKAGDEMLRYSTDQYALALDIPVVYQETPQEEIYISSTGIVSFKEKVPDTITPLQRMNRSAIAVYYAPVVDSNVYYRATSSNQPLLRKLSDFVRRHFADSLDFHGLQAVVITWDEVANKENDGLATYQLALISDGLTSFAILQYKDLPWSSSAGIYAQAGFAGRHNIYQSIVNSGTPDVKQISSLSNNNVGNHFIFRISGSAFEDPKENGDEYDYANYDHDYDGEQRKPPPSDCPVDPYADKCPDGCNILTDDRGCSKCICAEPSSSEEQESERSPPVAGQQVVPEAQPAPAQPAQPEVPTEEQQEVHQPPAGYESTNTDSCQVAGETACNQNAQCHDYSPGYCCTCQPGYYGNGKECLKKGEPQRISGFFEGAINGKPIDRTDLHTFVTATDGNAYTAVSKIPSDMSGSFLLLNPIGSVMGWLFADVQSTEAYNGFQLTGGLFNRTVTMHIGDRYYVTIKQEFSGRDIYHYLKANVFISGTLPDLAPDSEVVFPDYEEEYRREGSGRVRSYSGVDVIVRENGQEKTMRITIDQQITYKECAFRSFDKPDAMRLYVKRVHVTYDANDGVVRYGSRNSVNVLSSRAQPAQPSGSAHFDRKQHGQTTKPVPRPVQITDGVCAHGAHVCTLPNMRCRPFESSYRCECVEGFQAKHEASSPVGWNCQDIDECQTGSHTCNQNSRCVNSDGGFSCECLPGFIGESCISATAAEVPAQSVQQASNIEGSCTSHQQCHQYGECAFADGAPHGKCQCRGWYVGDGITHCGPPQQEQQQQQHQQHHQQQQLHRQQQHHGRGKVCGHNICDPHADCNPDTSGGSECVCKPGYVGNGISCESLLEDTPEEPKHEGVVGTVCRSHDECSEHGRCTYSHSLGYYQCECTEPYVGNGIDCQPPKVPGEIEIPYNNPNAGCDVTRDCHSFADCVFERTTLGGNYKCVCQSGYSGDGKTCTKSQDGGSLPPLEQPGCDRLRNCDQNAQCVFDNHNRKYKCECHEGFVGDGIACVRIHSGVSNWEGAAERPTRCRESTECHANGHCVAAISGNEYVCECLPGFRGDGVKTCRVVDNCNPSDVGSCNSNAACVFDTQQAAYVCQCVQGFTGDGSNCVPYAKATTCHENPRLCHANAQCVFNHEQNMHVCLCKPGSIGDGYTQCAVQDTPRCNNCSIHAHCAQSLTTGGYQCKCNAGYDGNGHVCAQKTSCLDDRGICDVHAECVPGEGGHYVCNCHYGYHGNGRTCSRDSEERGDSLFIARGMAIFQRGTTADILGKQVIVIPHHIAVGLDFDCEEERLVWSDISGHQLRSSSLNGSDQKAFLSNELNSPEGIAVDYSSRNVYYADSLNDEIGVASLDGKYKKTLVNEGLVNPRSVALDLYNRHVYYADWHRANPFIGRVDMDGKNNQIFLNQDMHLPNGLTVLPNRRELCWVDAGSHRLSCIGFDNQNRRVVYTSLEYPFGLTNDNEQRFYWTDWKDNRIHTVGIYGEGYASFPISLGGSGKVYGILSVPKTCAAPPSPCAVDNGGCKHLCLPGKEGVTCQCPDNVAVKGC